MNTINKIGIEEIRKFLVECHVSGERFADDTLTVATMLGAWAADAEFSMSEGNGPCIEIPSRNSATGRPVVFEVSKAGIEFRASINWTDMAGWKAEESTGAYIAITDGVFGEYAPIESDIEDYIADIANSYDKGGEDATLYVAIWKNGEVIETHERTI